MSAWKSRRWLSSSDASTGALEVSMEPLRPGDVAAALGTVDDVVLASSGFVMVRLAATDRAGLDLAVRVAESFVDRFHVCFMIDAATVACVVAGTFEDGQVGWMLDLVDADTPLSALLRIPLQGVSFDSRFVRDAHQDLRMQALLDAWLGLARDLALATFGPAVPTLAFGNMPAFDYVSGPASGVAGNGSKMHARRRKSPALAEAAR